MNKVGISGTRYGATEHQIRLLSAGLTINWMRSDGFEFHHGLCVGVDCQAHDIVRKLMPDVKIIGHPPVKTEHMGEVTCDELREAKSHFARNRDIVDETMGMIIVPAQMSHQSRGGTWYTYDYALKKKKPILIIWPTGNTTMMNS